MIDADDLLKAIDIERKYLKARGQISAEHILVHNFRELLENAPTVDAVEVVRCKDCKHYRFCLSDVAMTNKNQTQTIYESIDFCSHGERKESE